MIDPRPQGWEVRLETLVLHLGHPLVDARLRQGDRAGPGGPGGPGQPGVHGGGGRRRRPAGISPTTAGPRAWVWAPA